MPNLQTTDSSSGLNLWTKNHPVFLRHLIIWVIYSIYQQSIVFYVTKGKVFDIYSFLLNSVLDAFIFYASFYIFQHFLKPKKYVSVFIGLLALIAAFSGIKYGFEKIIFPCAGIQVADVFSADINKYVAANIWNTILYSGYGLGYFYALKAIQAEKDQRLLETEKRILIESELFHTQEILLKNQEILEKTQKVLSQEHQLLENEQELKRLEYERNQAQLAFLRSQINPHFLYNTLNFFYAKVLSHSREAAEGILVLVEMMKYALKEEDGNGKVMLDKEVQHLEISLN
ncbi:histidine kinase [Pseudarcicella hirudinis]|uniref:histidine kinase n=1 Tax=Pseudarcicella hirudinis TaxID=1079859 RepID=UPI0035EEB7BD